MIYEVKEDRHQKARLVAGGHLVNPRGISSRSTVVKGILVLLLGLIAHCDGLKHFVGTIAMHLLQLIVWKRSIW